MLLDGITMAKALLVLGHTPTLLLVIVLGSIWGNRETFYHIMLLLLLAGVVNVVLKAVFKIPLPPALGLSGFGFPSGHLLSATILYASIALKVNRPIATVLLLLLLVGIGYSLVYMGYHYYRDVLGALVFAGLLITSYHFCRQKNPEIAPWLALILATVMLLYLHFSSRAVPLHTWVCYSGLFGLVVGPKMARTTPEAQPLLHKIFMSLFWFLSTLAVSLYLQPTLWQGTPRTRDKILQLKKIGVHPCRIELIHCD